MNDVKQGSHKNIWYGVGRQRIEIPRPILKSNVINNPLLNGLYVASIGFYPKAKQHFTKRRHGLNENFLFYCVDGYGFFELNGELTIDGQNLATRDGLGIWNTDNVKVSADSDTEILIMEVPMTI